MKTRKSDISLREIFSEKLEFAEVAPDAALRAKLMRQVAKNEFLRFNPGRFNIFYMSGIMGAIIAVSAIIFSGSGSDEYQNLQEQKKINHSDTTGFLEIAVDNPVTLNDEIHRTTVRRIVPGISVKTETKKVKPAGSNKIADTAPGSIEHSISKNGLFPNAKPEVKKLKARVENGSFSKPSSFSGCAPLKVQFKNTSESYDSCIWTFGDGGFSAKKDPEWIYDVEGDYKVDLQIYRNGKIVSPSAAASVSVYPRPKAHFEISPVKTDPSNDEIRFLNYSTNAERFKWDFGDGSESDNFEPVHHFTGLGNYNVRLIVFSEWGCADTLTVYNAFSGSEYFIEFPNAFIPNEHGPTGGYYSSKSDEAAQVFHPFFTGVTEYQLKIFSKLGIPIFESNDINLGWDGYNKDQLCEAGVYIWKVRGKFRNNEPFIQMGDVTLLRNQ